MFKATFIVHVLITFISSFIGLWMATGIQTGYGWYFAFSGALAAGIIAYVAGSARTPWNSKQSLPITICATGAVAFGHILGLPPLFGAILGCLVYTVRSLPINWLR